MKKLLIVIAVALLASSPTFAQTDKKAMKLADKMAEAFSNGMGRPEIDALLRGRRLPLSIENSNVDPEFESKTFKSFTALERWLKSREHENGAPFRMSGERVSCRKGLCRLDLEDGQMMHSHIYLTRVWYGYDKRGIYVKRIRILYG
jgi:hypothetical protein